MLQISNESQDELLEVCQRRLSAAEIEDVERTLSFARSLSSANADHPSMSLYMSHPIRVARMSIQLETQPSVETVKLGLLHNVFEVSGLGEEDVINEGYSEEMAGAIRLLTIEREKQYDPDYLADFYGDIEQFGPQLVLIKSVDRLDNLLAFQLIERSPRIKRYIELSEQFVTPMSERLSPELGNYHKKVIEYMQKVGCDLELKSAYDAVLEMEAHN